MNIFLVGMTGSGKSTLGKQLAEELNYSFVDSDKWIEEHEGKTVQEIFQQDGESHFRKLETEFLDFVYSLKNTVIATGAGLPCMHDHMEQMNKIGTTIWLDVDPETIADRLSKDPTPRPKLADFPTIHEAIASLLTNRKKFYEQASLHIKNPMKKTLLQLVKQIL